MIVLYGFTQMVNVRAADINTNYNGNRNFFNIFGARSSCGPYFFWRRGFHLDDKV